MPADKIMDIDENKRRRNIDILLTAGFVLFSGIFRYVFWKRFSPTAITDMAYYVDIAQAWQELDFSNIIHFHFGPVYPFFIFLFHLLFRLPWGDAAVWVNIVAGSLTLIPLYVIAMNVFNRRTAVFTLVISSATWANMSALGYAEASFGLFECLAVMMAVLAWKKGGWWFILAGFTIGIANLVKSEGTLFWILIFAAYILWTYRAWKSRIPYYIGYILVYLAVMSPYLGVYYQETGIITINPKSGTSFFHHNKDYNEFHFGIRKDEKGWYTNANRVYLEGDRYPFQESILEFIKDDYRELAKNYLHRLYYNFTVMLPYLCYYMMPVPLLNISPLLDRILPILVSLVLVAAFIRTRKDYAALKLEFPLYIIPLGCLAAVAMFNIDVRFFYSVFLLLIIFYAKGLDQLLSWIEKLLDMSIKGMPETRRHTITITIGIFFAALILSFQIRNLANATPIKETVKEIQNKERIVEWLKPRMKHDDRIMAYSHPNRLSYFLGLPLQSEIILPIASIDDMISYARQEKVKYIILESYEVGDMFQSYKPLFYSHFRHKALKKEYEWMPRGEEAIVIYSIIYEENQEE